jgi:malonyl CoA-acyl carrier protein transacylase/SAM-dependent methyltransferase
MQSLPRDGSMVAVMADEARAREFVAARSADVSIAAVNGPASVVISGRTAAVEAVVAELTAAGIKSKPLNVSHAFHSPLMEPILDQFEAAVAGVALSAPRIKVISNVTGRAATAAELTSPRYWRDHLRGAVRFADGMQTLADGGFNVFVEAGPQPTAIAMATQSVPGGDRIWAASLRQKQEDWRTLLDAAAQLHLRGVEVDFAAIDRPFAARRTTLPPYPFQRTRFWVEPGAPAARTMVAFDDALHPLLGRRLTSPALNATVFEGRIARETHAYLYDHQVHGAAIMPATGFLELGLAAARAIGKAAPKVGDFAIREALTLPETGAVAVQVVMAAGEGGAKRFSIHSQSGDSWILHAEGSLEDAGHQDVPAPDVLDGGAIEPADFYARLRARGLEFGPAFHAVTRLAANGSEAEGLAELPSPLAAGESQFVVHPVLLDGALQVLAGALMSVEGGGDSYLPVHLEALELGEAPRGAVLARATLRDGDRRQLLRADITLLDPGDRRVVGRLTGLTLKRASRAALQRLRARDVSDTLYEIAWEPRELAVDDRLAWVPPAARLAEVAPDRVASVAAAAELPSYDRIFPALESLATAHVLRAFDALGWRPQPGDVVSLDGLCRELKIIARQERLAGRLLQMLEEDGFLEPVPGGWRVARPLAVPDVDAARAALDGRDDVCGAELGLVDRCGPGLAGVLRGDVDPLALLFPGGSAELAERLYQESPTAHAFNGLVSEVIARLLRERPEGTRLRVLEVGGGTGATSSFVLPLLPPDTAEYCFTDVSPLFTARAAEKFREYPFVRTQTADVERPLVEQGLAPQSFDLVVAANVLHATADLRATVERVRDVLAPGGALVMLEVTRPQRWIDLTFGMTEGWWKFTDRELRPDYPLISPEQWLATFEAIGFADAAVVPGADAVSRMFGLQCVLVARNAAAARGADPQRPWLVLGSAANADGVARALVARGHLAVVAAADRPQDRVTALAGSAANGPLAGVIDLHALDVAVDSDATTDALGAAVESACGSTLGLIQAMVAGSCPSARLVVVTRGAQGGGALGASASPVQASIWGLGRVAALEHPELRCTRVDLDPAGG